MLQLLLFLIFAPAIILWNIIAFALYLVLIGKIDVFFMPK